MGHVGPEKDITTRNVSKLGLLTTADRLFLYSNMSLSSHKRWPNSTAVAFRRVEIKPPIESSKNDLIIRAVGKNGSHFDWHNQHFSRFVWLFIVVMQYCSFKKNDARKSLCRTVGTVTVKICHRHSWRMQYWRMKTRNHKLNNQVSARLVSLASSPVQASGAYWTREYAIVRIQRFTYWHAMTCCLDGTRAPCREVTISQPFRRTDAARTKRKDNTFVREWVFKIMKNNAFLSRNRLSPSKTRCWESCRCWDRNLFR